MNELIRREIRKEGLTATLECLQELYSKEDILRVFNLRKLEGQAHQLTLIGKDNNPLTLTFPSDMQYKHALWVEMAEHVS